MIRTTSKYSAESGWTRKNIVQMCAVGLSCVTFSGGVALAEEGKNAQSEIAHSSESVVLAQELLVSGDSAYNKKDYKKAVAEYRQAFQLLSAASVASDLKVAAAERYAQAAVEESKAMARFGKYAEARALLTAVLAKSVAPNHSVAQQALARLDDPIHNNPSLTPQIARDAEAAGKWLRRAEGYYDLGKYDDALTAYEEVLHLDPTNKAARRGMERVNNAMSRYAGAAYDHARAKALADVDSAWELPNNSVDPSFSKEVVLAQEDEILQEVHANKMHQIIVPRIDIQDMDINEAVEMLRLWSKAHDQSTLDNSEKGLNFVVNIGDGSSEWTAKIKSKRVNLNLRNLPLSKVADYIANATGTQWRFSQHAVLFTPAGSADTEIYRRTFRVPPSFKQDASSAGTVNDDPFADDSDERNTLTARVSAQEYLESLGVSFPEGASAKYIQGSGSLLVSNTRQNLDLIEDYVRSISQTESVQVVMTVKVIDIAKTDAEALGFDWLFGANGSDKVFTGGSQGNGFDVVSSGQAVPNGFTPVTSGLRSGDSLFTPNALDNVTFGVGGVASDSVRRSPGILTLTGEDYQMVLRGLNNAKNTDQLDTTTVIARSGEKATIFSGRELMVPTEYEPPELPNTASANFGGGFPVTPSHPTAFEERTTGATLEVEATVSDDKNIVDVRLDFQSVDFDGYINYGSPITQVIPPNGADFSGTTSAVLSANEILMPLFSPVRINTGVSVHDGHTLVIGGLNQVDVEKVEDKVPVLGDIPGFGRFFQSDALQKTDRALVIFLTVDLKDPTGKNWRER